MKILKQNTNSSFIQIMKDKTIHLNPHYKTLASFATKSLRLCEKIIRINPRHPRSLTFLLLTLFSFTINAQEVNWNIEDDIQSTGEGFIKTARDDDWNNNLAESEAQSTSNGLCFFFDLSKIDWEGGSPFQIGLDDQNISRIEEASYLMDFREQELNVDSENFDYSLEGAEQFNIEILYGIVKLYVDGTEILSFSNSTTAVNLFLSFAIYNGSAFVGTYPTICSPSLPTTQNCQSIATYKYTESKSYSPSGRELSNGMEIRNNFGQPVQVQNRNYEMDKVLAKQVIYDRQGRAAMETFSAPLSGSGFCYDPNFVTPNGATTTYSYQDFDQNSTSSNTLGEEYNPKAVAQSSTLGSYYSGNTTPHYSNTAYPFVRKHFSNDLFQEPEKVSGYSEEFKAGSGREVTNVQMLSGSELEWVYGVLGSYTELGTDETNQNLNLFKTIGKNENGETVISYSNSSGQNIAAALSGVGGNCVSQVSKVKLKEKVQTLVHIPASKTSGLKIEYPDPRVIYGEGSTATYPTSTVDVFIYDKLNRKNLVSGTDYTITKDVSATNAKTYNINLLGSYQNVESILAINFELTAQAQTTWWEFLQMDWIAIEPQIIYELDYNYWQLNYFDVLGNLTQKVQPKGINCAYDASGAYSFVNRTNGFERGLYAGDVVYSAEVRTLTNNDNTLSLAIYPINIFEYYPDYVIGTAVNSYYEGHTVEEGPEGETQGGGEDPGSGAIYDAVPTAVSMASYYNNLSHASPQHSTFAFSSDGSQMMPQVNGEPNEPYSDQDVTTVYRMSHFYDIEIWGVKNNGTPQKLETIAIEMRDDEHITYKYLAGTTNIDWGSRRAYTFRKTLTSLNAHPELLWQKAQMFDKYTLGHSDGTVDDPDLRDYKRIELKVQNVKRNEKPYIVLTNKIGLSVQNSTSRQAINRFSIMGTLGHKMISQPADIVHNSHIETYEYNKKGQLLSSTLPDEGISEFVYATNGQLKFSQNAQQSLSNKFSYILYDKAFRPIETGEYHNNTGNAISDVPMYFTKTISGTPPSDNVHSIKDVEDGLNDLNCFSIITYQYDTKASDIPAAISSTFTQHYLRGVLSRSENTNSTTWYSYDNYGNIEWMAQDIYELGLKTIRYQYDNVGKLLAINYNEGNTSDDFYIKYDYDANEALAAVYSSDDPTHNFKKMSGYLYDELGNLTRKELGNNYQGMDLSYTVKGQLKSINNAFQPTEDLGQDGLDYENTFIADLFAETLSYHANDFKGAGSNMQTAQLPSSNEYTGLVQASTWYTGGNVSLSQSIGSRPTYQYSYDERGQLTQAKLGTSAIGDMNSNTEAGNAPAFTANTQNNYLVQLGYDLNGNISNLTRNAYGSSPSMDQLSYTYTGGKNSLSHITDVVATPSYGDVFNQASSNYTYDDIGRMVKDKQGDINITYNSQGLVSEVKTWDGTIKREQTQYNERSLAVRKVSYNATSGAAEKITYRVFDASSKLLAEYEKPLSTNVTSLSKTFVNGIERAATAIFQNGAIEDYHFEIKDHIGNVRTVFHNNPATELYTDFTQGSTAGWSINATASASFPIPANGVKISNNGGGGIYRGFSGLPTGGRYSVSVNLNNINVQGLRIVVLDQTNSNAILIRRDDIHEGNNEFTFNNVNTTSIAVHIIIPNIHAATGSYFTVKDVEITKDDLEILSYNDYYPAGWEMPGRKYQSSATDNEYGYSGDYSRKNAQFNWNEFQYRNYDTRIGRWLSPDPMRQYSSPYVGMGNNPVSVFDPTGLWGYESDGEYKWFDDIQSDGFTADGRVWTLVSTNLGRFENIAHKNNKGGIVENWFYSGYEEYDPTVQDVVGFRDDAAKAVALIGDFQFSRGLPTSGISPEIYAKLDKMLGDINTEYNHELWDYWAAHPATGRADTYPIIFEILSGSGVAKKLLSSGGNRLKKKAVEGFGDLTKKEINQIQNVVNQSGRPLDVVGSAASSNRRGVGTDLPLGKGLGTKSDIDYVAPPSSHPYFNQNKLPDIDPNMGIIPGYPNPNIGPSIRFEPGL